MKDSIVKLIKEMYGDVDVSFVGINTVCIISGKLVIYKKLSDF